MMKELIVLFVFVIFFNGFGCQVYYQPVQVLIPTVNGSVVGNNSVYNITPAFKPPPQNVYYSTYNNKQTNYSNNNGSQDGHLFLGSIQAFDRLLYHQEFTKTGRFWSGREKIIEYPKDLPAGYSRHETISAIRVYNQFLDGHGAKAELLDGGIGRQLVKIKLTSPWGMGFRYRVQIYGR
ncbi:uncharacterized protein LOC130895949 [Diorhabda carinulata]|uniref:uncharacterized protein LOC130895949 n=1 Tax=Diorhabda carinulata TaxID=1163345 RepID=UPI0025A21597|nr:uncharacterized protein LOC130895949 [Diorhabda carinulata]